MHSNQWLNTFKIALIQNDIDKLIKLHEDMPNFEKIEDLKTAEALIEQVLPILKKKRDNAKLSMEQIQKSIKFQRNSIQGKSRFDQSY